MNNKVYAKRMRSLFPCKSVIQCLFAPAPSSASVPVPVPVSPQACPRPSPYTLMHFSAIIRKIITLKFADCHV